MKVPVSWLWDVVTGIERVPSRDLADRLTAQGLAVETVTEAGRGLEGGIVARAVAVESHPNADHLVVVRLDLGASESTVVTGAPNVVAGALVPYLPPGGRLPSGVRMERRLFRGVPSDGMLLSAQEMGLGPDAEGICLLDGGGPEMKPGADLGYASGLPDAVLDLDLTPNVATFAQSVLGLGQEVAAMLGGKVRRPARQEGPAPRPEGSRPFAWEILRESGDDCPQYLLGLLDVEGLGAAPTPFWMRRRLLLSGMRLHGLAVDMTNYVMLETGQPLHAFDAEAVRGGRIGVRRARLGERLQTLDGTEVSLTPAQLVIADGEGPIGLAGVMGGQTSEVGPRTRRILLEAAEFDARAVRRSGRALGFFSEAQSRFEKGVDPNGVRRALERAIALFEETLGSSHVVSQVAGQERVVRERIVSLRPGRVAGLLGRPFRAEEVSESLQRLGFGVAPEGDILRVTVPSARLDIEGEVDLVEEVARITGYDRLPSRLPLEPPTVGSQPRLSVLSDALADALCAQGLTEVMTSPLISEREAAGLGVLGSPLMRIRNPLTADADTLRPSLLPGLVRAARLNLDRGREGVWIFDRGQVFAAPSAPGEGPTEDARIGALALGARGAADWRVKSDRADFFALKGLVWPLLEAVYGPEGAGFTVATGPGTEHRTQGILHPGRCLAVSALGRQVLVLGQLHPALEDTLDLPGPVIYWEWSLTDVPDRPQGAGSPMRVLRMPPATRDLACILPDSVGAGRALAAIAEAGGPLLEDVIVFDVYCGTPVPTGHRSLAFRLRYRAEDRTLAEGEIEGVQDRVRRALAGLGGELRS